MIRRLLARFVLAVSLVAASLAWVGFTASRTALDPARSERVAERLLADPAVRRAVADELAVAFAQALPAEAKAAAPPEAISSAAAAALGDARVTAVLLAGLTETHRYVLGELDRPPTLDAGAVAAAMRNALVTQRPELDAVVPAPPPLAVELPSSRLPMAGGLRSVLAAAASRAALLAAGGCCVALALSPRRSRTLARLGWWGVVQGGGWVALRYAAPALAERLAPTTSPLVRPVAAVLAEPMLAPALALTAAGALLVAVSLLWGAGRLPGLARRAAGAPATAPGAVAPIAPMAAAAHWSGPDASARADGPVSITPATGEYRPRRPPASSVPPSPAWLDTGARFESPAGRRWAEGVGYLDDAD